MDNVGYGLRTDGMVWVDGWTRGMGGMGGLEEWVDCLFMGMGGMGTEMVK